MGMRSIVDLTTAPWLRSKAKKEAAKDELKLVVSMEMGSQSRRQSGKEARMNQTWDVEELAHMS
jgi:hypothetical protein